jgi:transposase
MDFERTSMAQFEEIERLISEGHRDRGIARSLHCRRSLVSNVRRGLCTAELLTRAKRDDHKLPPGWALKIDWEAVERDLRGGHQIKRIWEEVAEPLTSHPNFFKYVKAKYTLLLRATVTLREFKPGEYCEVDYAGDKIGWVDLATGEIREAHVFVGILSFSQKIFAYAAENEKKVNWLESHRRMFEFYGGSARVLVPDQLRNGVVKSHLYDPDINPDYVELCRHYGTAVVPARVRRPKDKALVEGAVGILMRYFRFLYRRRTFTSLAEVNAALAEGVAKINAKAHSRFKVSREERYAALEKGAMQPLPLEPYEMSEWKTPTLHADCTVGVDHNFYSAPHVYRGKQLRVRLTARKVEIFFDLERIALHERARGKIGERIVDNAHLPPNARAYREASPQMILAQARFSHADLHALIDELFILDTIANLRRAQGLVRKAYGAIQTHGREAAAPAIACAVAYMRRFNRVRVRTFEERLSAELKKIPPCQEDRAIVRKSGNPMVRGRGTRAPGKIEAVPTQLTLV